MTETDNKIKNNPRDELIEKITIKLQDINFLIERIQRCTPQDTDFQGITIQELNDCYEDLVKGEYLLEMFRVLIIDEDDWETIV